MFCPEIRLAGYTDCPRQVCPFYSQEGEMCLKAVDVKLRLNILTQEEKAALTTIRKGGRK